MKFAFTPEEAQRTARKVSSLIKKDGFEVKIEKPFSETAPYRTTLIARQGQLTRLIEAQGALDYHRELEELARWLGARREYVELFLATSLDEATVSATTLQQLRRDGVGL